MTLSIMILGITNKKSKNQHTKIRIKTLNSECHFAEHHGATQNEIEHNDTRHKKSKM
jgi:hypothetical protein